MVPCSTNMVSKRVIVGAFLFLASSNFLYFGGVFNKTIILFALVGYEIGSSQLGPAGLVGYLTIRPVARKGYGSVAHEAKPNGLLTRGPQGRRV